MARNTQRLIADALRRLMQDKELDKITVQEIADEANVNKKTFYYHFQDIYALIEWSCEEDARKALSSNTTYDTWQQGFLNVLNAVEDNKPFIINVYRHVSQEQIIQYLYRVVYDLLINVIEECAHGMTVRDEDKKFIADFYKYAFVGLTLEWIKSDMKTPPKEIVSRLSELIDGDIPRMLEKCRLDVPLSRT